MNRFRPAILATVAFLALIGALETIGDGAFLDLSVWFLGAIVLAAALALPWRAAMVFLAFSTLIALAIKAVNEAKISLTDMPLTFLDLRIGFANPKGFLGAMKISPPLVLGIVGAVAVLAACALVWRLSRLDWAEARTNVLPRAAAVGLACLLVPATGALFGKRLQTAIMGHEYAEIANMPDGLLLIEKKIGAAPFLALTAQYDATAASPFRTMTAMAATASPLAPWKTPAFLKPDAAPTQKPDIFMVLLESTFDLPKIFDVTPQMKSGLFPESGLGQLRGALGVNAIGGGTWISEFEAITGIPSRLFGYAGYYTHVELAPYVKSSFATWLKAKGYASLGLYPVDGKFYGARAAYERYGFDRFIDGDEFRIDKPWFAADTEILADYIGAIEATDTSRPLFTFALTMENHSPHPCTRYGSEAEMPYRFAGPFAAQANKQATCELNEYIARYRSTETAIAMLETALRKRETLTGRPYVLAVFGDHQPNTFTGTSKTPLWTPNDYSKFRRGPNDVTFYQIRSSAPSPFAVETLDASIVMLPTLLSAYVARDSHDVYLPGNFAIQARCGDKIALPRLNTAYGTDAMVPEGQAHAGASPVSLTTSCQSALIEARSDYLKLIEMP